MVRKKIWAILLVCLLLVIPLVGCNGIVDVANLDPNALLKEVLQKLEDVKSASTQVSGTFDVTTPDENGKMVQASADIEATVLSNENKKAKVDVGITAKANGETVKGNIDMYLIEENGLMKIYYEVSATPESVEEAIVEAMPFKNGETLGSAESALPAVSPGTPEDYLTDPEIVGTENIGGKDTVHMRAELDLTKIMDQVQGSMPGEMTSDDQAQAKMMLMMLGDINVDIWADATTHDPVKMEIDLADQLKTFADMIGDMTEGEDADVTFNDLALKITITDFNAVPDIQVPVGLKATEGTKVKT